MSQLPEYVLERVFDAPIHLVWKSFTDPSLVAEWYGPNIETIIHRFDLETDGEWLNEMKWGGNSNFSKMVFKLIDEPSKLVWHHHSCTDAEWNDIDNPMMPGWPRLLLTTITFAADANKTAVRLSQIPMEATAAEVECFANAMSKMDGGWGSGFAILDELLKKMPR